MAEELEKTCENCEYECEDMEGTHCRHCIHNAEEHFKPKINHEKEIRAKAIDEFAKNMKNSLNDWADNRRNGWKFLRNGEDLAMAKAYENAVDLVDIIVNEMRGAE